MSQPDDNEIERVLLGRALAQLRAAAGLSQAKAGDAFGVSGQNWAKYELGRAPGIFQPAVQRRLTAAVGADVEALMLERAKLSGEAPPRRPGFGLGERNLWVASRGTDPASLPVSERVHAGAWLFAGDGPDIVNRTFQLGRDPRYPQADQWLAEVADDSASGLSIFDGDLVHCVAAGDIGYFPKTGDLVLVERRRLGGEERELTVRQVEVTENAVILWTKTDNIRFRGSTPLPMGEPADGEPSIRALIVNQVRRF